MTRGSLHDAPFFAEPTQRLAAAIVLQAVEDFRKARLDYRKTTAALKEFDAKAIDAEYHRLRKAHSKARRGGNAAKAETASAALADYKKAHKTVYALRKKRQEAVCMRTECSEFFRSEWFRTLCTLDGKAILRKLKKE